MPTRQKVSFEKIVQRRERRQNWESCYFPRCMCVCVSLLWQVFKNYKERIYKNFTTGANYTCAKFQVFLNSPCQCYFKATESTTRFLHALPNEAQKQRSREVFTNESCPNPRKSISIYRNHDHSERERERGVVGTAAVPSERVTTEQRVGWEVSSMLDRSGYRLEKNTTTRS